MFSENSASRATEFLGNNEPKTHARTQGNAAKHYVFTKYNCDSAIEPDFQESLKLICEEFQYSHEICPSTKRPHLQGQLILKKKMRITQIVKFKHLNMHLEIQRGTQFENNTYIIKNTDNHITWKAPKANLRFLFKQEFEKLSTDCLWDLRFQLLNRLYANNKIELEIQSGLPKQLEEAFTKSNDTFDARAFALSDCIFFMIELKNKKEAVNIIDKYL